MSLFSHAQDALTVALLTLRPTCSNVAFRERLSDCRGVEMEMLKRALPAAGLRPEALLFLIDLERFWREACEKEFPSLMAMKPTTESWQSFYSHAHQQTSSKLDSLRHRLRATYQSEEDRIHQLKVIPTAPRRGRSTEKRPRFSSALMEKSLQEAQKRFKK